MKIKPIKWEQSKAGYSNSLNAMIEHIRIGYVCYDPAVSRGQTKFYKAWFFLGGYKQPKENFETEEQGIAWVEKIFKVWIEKITDIDG